MHRIQTPEPLKTQFDNRAALSEYVGHLAPWLEHSPSSPFHGGHSAAQSRLEQIEPARYGRTRNFLDGAVTHLSPYIRHGILSLTQVKDEALTRVSRPQQAEKFVQELAWRDFWQRVYQKHPEWIWHDVEDYKTGWKPTDYAIELPDDIRHGETGVACIDYFIRTLLETGYLHNHARMYVASYIVHWRRIRWQAGAHWFLHHLLDGDAASNNLSWQWVASTFSRKPYIFNLENVQKYSTEDIDTRPATNTVLDASYDELTARLFPQVGQL